MIISKTPREAGRGALERAGKALKMRAKAATYERGIETQTSRFGVQKRCSVRELDNFYTIAEDFAAKNAEYGIHGISKPNQAFRQAIGRNRHA